MVGCQSMSDYSIVLIILIRDKDDIGIVPG